MFRHTLLKRSTVSATAAAAAAARPLPRTLATSSRLAMAPTHSKKSPLPDGYREDFSKGNMLRFEDSLPRLPVPSLEETAKRYLKSVHPLLSKEEFEKTTRVVNDFIKPGSIGETLQRRLVARRQDPNIANWIYEYWNAAAYLTYRDPVVPYVSYFYAFRDDKKRRDPAKRAAAITSAALEFKKLVDSGSLEPEYMKKLPLSMEQYQWMFNCSRIPHETEDYPQKFDPKQHKHILVIRKNQFFKVMHEVDGQQLNTAELHAQFSRIYEKAQKQPAVGALTSQNRDAVFRGRAALLAAHPSNAEALKDVESASFVVCLDDASPVTLEERAHQFWHGDGMNRWYDKPVQFIVNDNGTAGAMGEHSMMDGTPTHRLCDFVNMLIFSNKLDFDNPAVRSGMPEPLPISFVVNEAVTAEIYGAQRDFDNVIGQHELKVQAFQGYGKELIKKFKCSPDGFVQMLIQLAYYKMHGINRPTYESAATRRFKQGRTETSRTVCDESVAWTRAMEDSDVSDAEKIRLFRAAIKSQGQYIADASDGRGVDRHLFGLKKQLKDGEAVPDIYNDPTYAYSSKWYISSSQLSSEYFNGYGWSQVIDEGFGCAYMINPHSLNFNVVSKRLGSDRFAQYINDAAVEMADLLRTELDHKPKL